MENKKQKEKKKTYSGGDEERRRDTDVGKREDENVYYDFASLIWGFNRGPISTAQKRVPEAWPGPARRPRVPVGGERVPVAPSSTGESGDAHRRTPLEANRGRPH